jgi:hypothetical protein
MLRPMKIENANRMNTEAPVGIHKLHLESYSLMDERLRRENNFVGLSGEFTTRLKKEVADPIPDVET